MTKGRMKRVLRYLITLPPIIDINNLAWMVKLVNSPSWVLLKSANTIELNTSDLDYQIPKTSLITIRITNEMNSWSEYNLTVNVQDIITPIFGNIKDFSLPRNKTSTIKIDFQGDSNIIIIDCLSKATLTWITYNPASKELIINTNGIILKSQWAILKTFDSWNNVIYSNKFDILILIPMPLHIGNSIGRLIIFKGENKPFSIPTDLFVSPYPQSLKINANVLNCSEYAPIISKIVSSDNAINSFLYVNSNTTMSWNCSISATDSSNQTIETTFYLDVQSWMSRNWLKWTNSLSSSWTEWMDDYLLTNSGEWILSSKYFKQPFIDIFNLSGFIILIILFLGILLSFIIGIQMLQSLEFAQTLIIFIYSSSSYNANIVNFGSWLQISKLDLGFLYTTETTNLLNWHADSRIAEIQYYCQSFCLNYIFVILSIFIVALLLRLINYFQNSLNFLQNIALITNNKITKEKIVWTLIHLFIPFVLINLVNEAFSISNHLIITLVSYIFVIAITVFIIVRNSNIMTLDFIRSIDQNNPVSFSLLTVVKTLLHTWMFLYNGDMLRIYIEYLELGVHLLIAWVIYFHYKQKGTSLLLIIKHMTFSVILFMFIWRRHYDISEQLLKTEVMLIVVFFVFFLFTEPIPFIVSRYTKVK